MQFVYNEWMCLVQRLVCLPQGQGSGGGRSPDMRVPEKSIRRAPFVPLPLVDSPMHRHLLGPNSVSLCKVFDRFPGGMVTELPPPPSIWQFELGSEKQWPAETNCLHR